MYASDIPASDSAEAPQGLRRAWGALLAAARAARQPQTLEAGRTYAFGPGETPQPVPDDSAHGLLEWEPPRGWIPAAHAPPDLCPLLDLYLPVCNVSAAATLTIGHLGQGLDGYIATCSGDSNYVTGPENILHLHRMRALCDAVLVGAGTVAVDDPQLTARRAGGANPVRVILDPQRRLAPTHRVFSDGAAPTLLICDAARIAAGAQRVGQAEILGIPVRQGGLDLNTLLQALHARQIYAVFVEGGGKTVSAFLAQGLLDRLQIAVAPVLTGAGRPGLQLAGRQHMHECLRLSPRIFAMGEDILFDCDITSGSQPSRGAPTARSGLARIV